MRFRVTLLRVAPESNPEEHTHIVEAASEAAARKQAMALFEEPHLGWASYGDPALWGKTQQTVKSLENLGG